MAEGVIEGRYGQFKIVSHNDLISASIIEYGEWAQAELDIMQRFITSGDCVLDVGAYVGTHSRAFSSFVGASGCVHAFEPHLKVFAILEHNVALAPTRNISAHQLALGPREGVAQIISHDEANLGATSVRMCDANEAQMLAAETFAPMKPIDALGLDRVAFIKLDAEAFELPILEGARQTIQRHNPVIAMEINSVDAAYPVLVFCARAGYGCFGYAPPFLQSP